jgi:hypothetical protein
MLRLPAGSLTQDARENLDRFLATSAAKEIEDDPSEWKVIEWTWTKEPPIRVHLRNEASQQVIDFVMDATGVWQLWREPMERRLHHPVDGAV